LKTLVSALLLLKRLPRTGWLEEGVKNPESVASHSYSLAVMAMAEAEARGLDVCKAVKMALLHDLAESYTGDLTPATKKKIPKNIFHQVERAIIRELVSSLPPHIAQQYTELYEEYLERRTPEARLVHRLDRRELVEEALWLNKRQKISLNRFGIA